MRRTIWWDWYAAYLNAREHGSSPDEASDAASRYMEEVLRVRGPMSSWPAPRVLNQERQ